MSIDQVNDLGRRVQYEALAAQDEFDYPFAIFDENDLVVDVDGAVQTISTDYTVAGVEESTGGTITFTTPLTGGEIVTMYSDTVVERTTDLQQNGPLTAARFNDEFDRIFIILQELKARLGRAIRMPFNSETTDAQQELSPVSNWFGKFLRVSAAGVLEAAELISSVVPLTQSLIGQLLNPITQAEIDAGVTPTNYWYQAGPIADARRYGFGEGRTQAQNAASIVQAISVLQQESTAGGTVQLPPGMFDVGQFLIPARILIRGAGPLATWLVNADSGNFVTFGTTTNTGVTKNGCGLADVALFCDHRNGNAGYLRECVHARIQNVYTENNARTGNTDTCAAWTIDGGNVSSYFNHFDQVINYHWHVGFRITGTGSTIATQQIFTGCTVDGDVSIDADSVGLEVLALPNGGNGQNSIWIAGNLEHCGTGIVANAGYMNFVGIRTEGNTKDVVHGALSSPQTFEGGLIDDTKVTDNSGAGYERHVYRDVFRPDGTRWSSLPGPQAFRSSVLGEIPVDITAYPTATTQRLLRLRASGGGEIFGVDSEGVVRKQGFRSGAGTPVGSVTPLFVGEIYFDSSAPKHYMSNGTGNTAWAALY